jgi:hypothetical protein
MQRAELVIAGTTVEQATDFIYIGNVISEFKTGITTKMSTSVD